MKGKVQKFIKSEANQFDALLDKAIDKVRTTYPNEWQIILDYIDSQATVKLTIVSGSYSIEEAGKEACRAAGVAKLVYRLTNFKDE